MAAFFMRSLRDPVDVFFAARVRAYLWCSWVPSTVALWVARLIAGPPIRPSP
jgi:hypothetical protein